MRLTVATLVLAAVLVPAVVAGAAPYDNTVVSVAGAGSNGSGDSGPGVAMSAAGDRIAFESAADNLSIADNDAVLNVYVRDVTTGDTVVVSRNDAGAGGDADSRAPAISADGRWVAFESRATNLSDADDDAAQDVFLYDTVDEKVALVSISTEGVAGDADSGNPSVSGNGDVVAFDSLAKNLSADDDDAVQDVFMRRRAQGTTTLISRVKGSGVGGNGRSFDPSISTAGNRIAFASDADNLYDDDRDIYTNVFVVGFSGPFPFLFPVSRTSRSGSVSAPADGHSTEPVISGDGGFVAFTSEARNLATVTAPRNVFLHYLQAGATSLVSRAAGQGVAGSDSSGSPAISHDGLQVAFTSIADNISDRDDDGVMNVFVRHAYYGTTTLVSRATGADGAGFAADSGGPAISSDATAVAFASLVLEPPPATGFVQVLRRELPFVEPPPVIPPDLGLNDHGGHDGGGGDHGGAHSADEHGAAGHDAGHGGHSGANHFRLMLGSLRGDRIFGTATHDKACGGSGDDVIVLAAGSDVGYGGECGPLSPPEKDAEAWWRAQLNEGDPPIRADGNDELKGRKGEDALYGGGGKDRLVGGSGRDLLVGGPGADRLVGGPGRNRYLAGSGNDSINSANGVRELVDCGFGRDRVRADRRDTLSGCERVRRVRKRAKQDVPELLPECPGGGHDCHQGGTVVLRAAGRP